MENSNDPLIYSQFEESINHQKFEDTVMLRINPEWDKALIALFILVLIGIFWFIPLLIVTIKFWKAVGLGNKYMLVSFICFNIALVLRIVYLITSFFTIQQGWNIPEQWLFGFFIYIDNLFFNWGVLLSIFNWLHLTMKLNQYLSYVKSPIKIKRLIIWMTIIIILMSLFFMSSFILTWTIGNESYDLADEIIRIVRIIIFFIEATVFIVVGLKLDAQLSKIILTS